jgi:uncharacterized phage protein (TIGR01671 family)
LLKKRPPERIRHIRAIETLKDGSMKLIEFRGMNKETGKFVYGYYTKQVEGIRRFDAIISEVDGDLTRFYIHDQKTIGQYMGVNDKDGIKIFEKDVCTVDGKVFYIDWRGNGDWFVDPIDDSCYVFSVECYDIKVIGNMIQNPELVGVYAYAPSGAYPAKEKTI